MIHHYRENNRVKSQLSRARKAGVEANLQLSEWLGILEYFNYKCAYCQTKCYTVMDHIIPLKLRGGTVATNVVPACYDCNAKKDRAGQERNEAMLDRVTTDLQAFLLEHGPFPQLNQSQQ